MMTPEQLGITAQQHAALVATLQLAESDQLQFIDVVDVAVERNYADVGAPGLFNMNVWNGRVWNGRVCGNGVCGTVHCLAGTAEALAGEEIFRYTEMPQHLHDLFWMDDYAVDLTTITVQQAARALRSFLETGRANWREACREP